MHGIKWTGTLTIFYFSIALAAWAADPAGRTAPADAGQPPLRLCGFFKDHMVLQRDVPVPVWGWAEPGMPITVEFAGQKKSATADAQGKWMVRLDPMPASAMPGELIVTSQTQGQKLNATDVLIGDVWLCSGQSNMGIPMNIPSNDLLQRRIREAHNPLLRYCQVAPNFPDQPLSDVKASWNEAKPETVRNWFAVGYLFGDRVQREIGVPLGILGSAMGGTMIENWTPREVLDANPANQPYFEQRRAALKKHEADKTSQSMPIQWKPTACFNGMIAPLAPFALKGVIWYQGEGNVTGSAQYPSQMADLMRVWRGLFLRPDLPFIMTELAPYGLPSETPQDSPRARFGEALARTAKADGRAWVITIVDGGACKDIHPPKKEIPGERFAAMALAKVYGKSVPGHGPVLESWNVEAARVTVRFSAVGDGLAARAVNLDGHELSGGILRGFELAGRDKQFFRADARIEGRDTVVVESAQVPAPVAVRYAWAAFPLCNLFNSEGFAAYPFRAEPWP